MELYKINGGLKTIGIVSLFLFSAYFASGQVETIDDCFRKSPSELSCLKFGSIDLDSDESVIRSISREVIDISHRNDSTNTVYRLDVKKSKTTKEFKRYRSTALFVLSVRGQIQSIQLYGYSRVADLDFFGINLGSSFLDVEKKFGSPITVRHHDGMNAEIWEYTDGRYTFVVKSGRVVSIRISRSPILNK